ncbi:MAG: DUF4435 domain-containing protein [Cyanobacteria bacterium P01_G01_bin.54]
MQRRAKEDLNSFVDENLIANELRMLRYSSGYEGSFLLVEGNSDKKFYGNLIDQSQCKIRSAPPGVDSNRSLIIKTIEILKRNGFEGALGIVDRDFDAIRGEAIELENLILTDDHDLEVMLVRSPAFVKVLREFVSSEKLGNKTIESVAEDCRGAIAQPAIYLGYLRWISQRDNLNLRFRDLVKKFKDFINKDNLAIDITKLIKTITDRSERQDLASQLQRSIQELESQPMNIWQICCGHDLTAILGFALQKLWGTHNTQAVSPDILERELRLAYEKDDFKSTHMFDAIKVWEQDHPPYRMLLNF